MLRPILPIGSLSLALCIACIQKLLLIKYPPSHFFSLKCCTVCTLPCLPVLYSWPCHQLRLATRRNGSCRISWPYCDVATTDEILTAAFNTTKWIRPKDCNDALYYPLLCNQCWSGKSDGITRILAWMKYSLRDARRSHESPCWATAKKTLFWQSLYEQQIIVTDNLRLI